MKIIIKNIGARQKIKPGVNQTSLVWQTDDDQVDLSAWATQGQAASKLAKSFPAVREVKIARIRNQIETGSYLIDTGKIAAAMLIEAFSNESY